MRIGQILKSRGWSQTRLAEAVDTSRGHISMLVSNKKTPSLEMLQNIAAELDVEIGSLFETERSIAVAGRVGAGAEVNLVDAYEKGDGLYHVACPDDLPSTGVVAVEVHGNSMTPIIQPGDILFFSRHFVGVDMETLGQVMICETEDGRALVKQIKTGRDDGTFDLYSANNSNSPEYGVKLKWAAPLRRHIAKQDVQVIIS